MVVIEYVTSDMSLPADMLARMGSDSVAQHVRLAGITSFRHMAEAGLPLQQVRTLTRTGQIVRIGRGYYATSDLLGLASALPYGKLLLEAAAAALALGPDSVVSHETAAQLHELSLLTTPGPDIVVTRPRGASSNSAQRRGIRLHLAALPESHIGGRLGVPLTTVARTVIDVARATAFRDGVVIADSALKQGLTSKKELRSVLADCQRWRGTRQAAEVVEFADRGGESPLESLARIVFRECGFPPPKLQVEIWDSEFIGRVDFLWEQYKTIVEVDGAAKYDDRNLAMRQFRRDKRLREAGYEVVHFEWREIIGDPAYIIRSMHAAFARGSRHAGIR